MLHHIYRAYFGGESKTVLHVPQNEVALLKMLLLVLNPALPTSKTLNSRGLAITEPSLNTIDGNLFGPLHFSCQNSSIPKGWFF